jgi:hypothetical protein
LALPSKVDVWEIVKAEEDIENGCIISHKDVKNKIDERKKIK